MPNPTVPVPYTWTTGTPILADVLRGQVSDTIALLSNLPMFNGIQTGNPQANIATNTNTAVQLNTEITDNYLGHLNNPAGTNPYYFPQIPGWYLAQGVAPYTLSSGGSRISTMITGIQNGGASTDYGGAVVLGASANNPGAIACKLMKAQVIGTDRINLSTWQATGSGQPLANTGNAWPSLTCRWVAALSGTAGLPVPVNAAWPVPPADITAAFMLTNVTQVVEFLTYPPICEYSGAVAVTVPSSATLPTTTGTTLVLQNATVDNYSAYNTSTGVWTAPVAGSYFAYGAGLLNMNAGGAAVACGMTITSSNYNGGVTFTQWGGCGSATATATCGQAYRRRLRLHAGDTLSLAAAQNDTGSAGASNSTGTWTPRFITVWEGA